MSYYGRDGDLKKLHSVRTDYNKPYSVRKKADEAFNKIVAQLKDKKLMAMRERLIRAAQAGDALEQHKIVQQMRDYEHKDRETGFYENTSSS